MKFNKELDENAVPEWKTKYLNYKQGKKKLKAVARAIRTVERSPQKNNQEYGQPGSSLRDGPVSSFLNRGRNGRRPTNALQQRHTLNPAFRPGSAAASSIWEDDVESGRQASKRQVDEWSPLRMTEAAPEDNRPQMTRYGSIIGSPGGSATPSMENLSPQATQASLLELPDPALDPEQRDEQVRRSMSIAQSQEDVSQRRLSSQPLAPPTQLAHTGNAYQVRKPTDRPTRMNSVPSNVARPPLLQRVFSLTAPRSSRDASMRDDDVALEAYREVDFRKAEFFLFLDKELEKIETFYKEKETEATERLSVLRHQLHIMRNKRLEEVNALERNKQNTAETNGNVDSHDFASNNEDDSSRLQLPNGRQLPRWTDAVASRVDNALDKIGQVRTGPVGKTSKAMRDLGTPPSLGLDSSIRDYVRRPLQQDVSYRTAKRKLKAAIREYYRELEMLKSYALLNHTAFRKITKKCDKTLPEFPGKHYMNQRVDRSLFATSQVVDGLMNGTEDLYARYFERGNNKLAIEMLRNKRYRHLDFTWTTTRTGAFGGIGFLLAIQGLVLGLQHTRSLDPSIAVVASYLLQIYAGYFLVVILASMFCLETIVFKNHRINYPFIFELNRRHNLDYRQISDITSVFVFLLGLTMFLNFQGVGGGAMYRFWPIVLVGTTLLIWVFPYPVYYSRSRMWFVYSCTRLLGSGFLPVEFRDLFFGDLTCSLTYVFGNISLFFCLYARDWNNPPGCNSSNSVVMGIFTILPGLGRFLQCLSRYRETQKLFPHVVNAGKYTCTMLMYMSLMLFRLKRGFPTLVAFAVMSSINSVYCITWDLKIDFSLLDADARFLREDKLFGYDWWYYSVMVIDVILRFNWVMYVIFAHDIQHSTIVSFGVALSEVTRRGLWALFRVENEQCGNNRALKAARDLPLPFPAPSAIGPQVAEEPTGDSPLVQTLRRVGNAMGNAHRQDYERRWDPAQIDGPPDSDEDDEE